MFLSFRLRLKLWTRRHRTWVLWWRWIPRTWRVFSCYSREVSAPRSTKGSRSTHCSSKNLTFSLSPNSTSRDWKRRTGMKIYYRALSYILWIWNFLWYETSLWQIFVLKNNENRQSIVIDFFRSFIQVCQEAMELNGRLISTDQLLYHDELKSKFQQMQWSLAPLLDIEPEVSNN